MKINVEIQKSEHIKILKPNDLKFRPIVAGPSCPTNRLGKLIDILLQPFLNKIENYIRNDIQTDDYSLLQIRQKFHRYLATKQIEVCPVTLRRKENTGMWTRILMSFKKALMAACKKNPCTVSRTIEEKQLRMLEQELSI